MKRSSLSCTVLALFASVALPSAAVADSMVIGTFNGGTVSLHTTINPFGDPSVDNGGGMPGDVPTPGGVGVLISFTIDSGLQDQVLLQKAEFSSSFINQIEDPIGIFNPYSPNVQRSSEAEFLATFEQGDFLRFDSYWSDHIVDVSYGSVFELDGDLTGEVGDTSMYLNGGSNHFGSPTAVTAGDLIYVVVTDNVSFRGELALGGHPDNQAVIDMNPFDITIAGPGGNPGDFAVIGDANDDEVVDGLDVNIVSGNFGLWDGDAARINGDVNGDGYVNGLDVNIVGVKFGFGWLDETPLNEPGNLADLVPGWNGLYGDVNQDGKVNGLDHGAAAANIFEFEGGGAMVINGDPNGDGIINGLDINIVSAFFGSSLGPSPVPEPASAVLACLALVCFALAKRRLRRK